MTTGDATPPESVTTVDAVKEDEPMEQKEVRPKTIKLAFLADPPAVSPSSITASSQYTAQLTFKQTLKDHFLVLLHACTLEQKLMRVM